jgi:hypothetical protein
MVLQQLQDALDAATNAPLCDSIDSTDTTVDAGSPITCTANVTSNGASFDCARELNVVFFYFFEGGNDSGYLFGNQDTVFGPIENVRDIHLSISITNMLIRFTITKSHWLKLQPKPRLRLA